MAKDLYHHIVKEALEREGWKVLNDPFIIKSEWLNAKLEIDLALEKTIIAEKRTTNGTRKILVEVKSFIKPSLVNELHGVIGQYFNYSLGVEELEEPYELYLAIPELTYDKLSEMKLFTIAVQRLNIKVIVFNHQTKTIVSWNE